MGLTHLLDTSALIAAPDAMLQLGEPVATSVICIGELRAGVLLAGEAAVRGERSARLAAAERGLVSLDIDDAVASAYAQIRARTGRARSNDLWIAATALAHGLTLVTRDAKLAALDGVESLLL